MALAIGDAGRFYGVMRFWRTIAAVAVLGGLGGCTLDDSGPVHSVFRPDPPKPAFVDVIYVTDRAPDPAAGGGFGTKWAARASCGTATAVVPAAPTHSETVWGYVSGTKAAVCEADGAPLGGAVAAIVAAARAKRCHSVFLFVHGYHTGFDGGVLRAAQVAHDAQTGCVVAAFSWTSEVKLDRYAVDQERSAYAGPLLREFLRELAESGLQVSVLGHSMGARMTLSALADMAQSRLVPPKGFIGELVLAAADIGIEDGNDDFALLLRDAAGFAKRTTIYASGGDAVLQFSRSAHGGVPRAGREPLAAQSDAKTLGGLAVDVIDATSVPADTLGHSYFSMSYEAVYDLTMALHGVPVEDRLKPNGAWPATLVDSESGAPQLYTDRRPRLVSRTLVRLVPMLE